MMDALYILALACAAGVAWFIAASLKTRERANDVARGYCRDNGLQFLDGSVGFGTLGIVQEDGRWLLRRVYVFGYSEDHVGRRHGAVVFVAGRFRTLLLLPE